MKNNGENSQGKRKIIIPGIRKKKISGIIGHFLTCTFLKYN
jgi:hypothetical protein